MSAHRIYCYALQRVAVESYLADLGAPISRDVPHVVHTADQLRGLNHITFVVIDNHASPVPQSVWEAVVADGALVIHVDDQYMRDSRRRVVPVRHYAPAKDDYLPEGMSVEQRNKAFSPCGS